MANLSKRRQYDQAINAGSMADIAFLLLIFFLVTTTIVNETGIRVRLPVWEIEGTPEPKSDRNILSVLVNAFDELLVESQPAKVEGLRERIKQFIMNPESLETLASSPKMAIISLQNDRGTSYKKYIEVYNEVKAAYNELWDESSKIRFGKSYTDLNEADRQDVRNDVPLVISEAEPTNSKAVN
jgi:biopolymer transport protein ExbD